jgi:spermidine synthase
VIEIDPAIVRVATEQFDFQESDRLKLHVADGLTFIKNMIAKNGKEKELFNCNVK